MKLNLYSTMDYDNKSGLLTMAKQTQSNPIYGEQSRTTCSELACPELACGELVEPVEGSNLFQNGVSRPWRQGA
jgi:hypothetical protein